MNIALDKKPPRKKRRNRSEWEQLIQAYNVSGLSSKQFCLANDLGYASFCQWRRQLSGEMTTSHRSDSNEAISSSFIDISGLSPLRHGEVDSSSSSASWQIVLRLGNGVELCLNQHGHVPS